MLAGMPLRTYETGRTTGSIVLENRGVPTRPLNGPVGRLLNAWFTTSGKDSGSRAAVMEAGAAARKGSIEVRPARRRPRRRARHGSARNLRWRNKRIRHLPD